MAQTFSTAREPSMEEILASIRRIIEDSDVTKQVSAELSAPLSKSAEPEMRVEASLQPQAEVTKAATLDPVEKRGEIAQFRRPQAHEDNHDDGQHESQNQDRLAGENTVPSLSLQAVLRGSIDGQQTANIQANQLARAEMHDRNVASVRIAAVNPPVPPVVVAAEDMPVLKTTKASEVLLMQIAEQRVVSMNQPAAKQEDAAVVDSTSDKPLISQAAEEHVAASFGSLSQALLEEQKRLLNEKMETMLRPMLQQWLDTNLPPLVERLVREEIERVVRRG
ncbi:PopZ family protein [Pseudochrobactrum sp. MP213Fo]|uniref:PopZ family protein n=1 Tax=Pseudochrobactrum sp. MP213Fo TaxID=3022250 RepID=UPI003BA2CAD2